MMTKTKRMIQFIKRMPHFIRKAVKTHPRNTKMRQYPFLFHQNTATYSENTTTQPNAEEKSIGDGSLSRTEELKEMNVIQKG